MGTYWTAKEGMKTFRARIEKRYVWDCPYCQEICESDCEDPESEEWFYCHNCGKDSKCGGIDIIL